LDEKLGETRGVVARLGLMRVLAVVLLMVHASSTAAEPPPCAAEGAPYDRKVFAERVGWLASKPLGGRAPGTAGDAAARAWIAAQFRCLGLTPAGAGGSFELPFRHGDATSANVVGYLEGSDPALARDIIYVGAHHDHEGGDRLGANDNASGIVAMLGIAQAIRQRADRPKRTIVFAAFGAEEAGMIGSYELAAHPPAGLENERVVQFVNLDMVGSHGARGYVTAMGARPKLAARPLLDALIKRHRSISVAAGGIARGSDFEPLCKLHRVPYVFFWTPDPACYHRACDTADRIDYVHMVEIAALAGDLVMALGDTAVDLAAARTRHGCGV
jgi:hypothetical protein